MLWELGVVQRKCLTVTAAPTPAPVFVRSAGKQVEGKAEEQGGQGILVTWKLGSHEFGRH